MITWQPGMSLEFLEKMAIQEAMKFFQNNKTSTARALGIAIRTLDTKLEKYAVEEKEFEVLNERDRKQREEFMRRCRGASASGTAEAQNGPAGIQNSSNAANAGLHVESAAQASPQQSVSMHQRKEVQSVLPSTPSHSGKGGRR